MNTKAILLATLLTLTLALQGCGGSSDSSQQGVNNERTATGSSALGYYGKDVIFGHTIATGVWHMTTDEGYTGRLIARSNGEYSDANIYTDLWFNPGNYGVSKDGRIFTASDIYGHTGTVVIDRELQGHCYMATIDRFDIEGYGVIRNTSIRICKISPATE